MEKRPGSHPNGEEGNLSSESPQHTHWITRPHSGENLSGGFAHSFLLATCDLLMAGLCCSVPLTVCAASPSPLLQQTPPLCWGDPTAATTTHTALSQTFSLTKVCAPPFLHSRNGFSCLHGPIPSSTLPLLGKEQTPRGQELFGHQVPRSHPAGFMTSGQRLFHVLKSKLDLGALNERLHVSTQHTL